MVAPVVAAAAISAAAEMMKTPAAGPSSADAVFSTNLDFDNSGWNITFGANSDISAPSTKTTEQGGATGGGKGLTGYLPWGILFVGALIAFKALKQ